VAIRERGSALLSIDLRPDLDVADLARRLAAGKPGASMATRLRKAAGLSPLAAGLLREAHGVTLPDAHETLARYIKDAPLRLVTPEPIARAISTAGGVSFSEFDARFMLRAHPGIFLAGEMLDWEAPTGGYLLQACFATGRAAAEGIIAWLGETKR
jgi:predicted flavoprotein YhiN